METPVPAPSPGPGSRSGPEQRLGFPDLARADAGTVLLGPLHTGTPEQQRVAGDGLLASWRGEPLPLGLLSVTVLASTDGEALLTCAQWTDDEAERTHTNRLRRTAASGDGADADGGADRAESDTGTESDDGAEREPGAPAFGSVRYRVHGGSGPRAVAEAGPADVLVLTVFDVEGPERQHHVADVLSAALSGGFGEHRSGARLLLSTDGTRVVVCTGPGPETGTGAGRSAHDELCALVSGAPGVRPTFSRAYRPHGTLTAP